MAAVLKSARELAAAGKDLGKLSQDLLGFFRNLVIYQVSPTALEGDISTPEKNVLAEVSGLISRGAALGILEELSHLESRLRYALAKDVVFEVALIQMSQLKEKISLESILETLGGAPPGIISRANRNAPSRCACRSRRPCTNSGHTGFRSCRCVHHRRRGKGVGSHRGKNLRWNGPWKPKRSRASQFHASKADQLEVMLPKALEKKLFYLRSPRNLEILEKSLTEQLGAPIHLVFLIGDTGKAAPPPPTASSTGSAATAKPAPPPPNLSQEAFLADPVIQNALKIFEAKIVTPLRPVKPASHPPGTFHEHNENDEAGAGPASQGRETPGRTGPAPLRRRVRRRTNQSRRDRRGPARQPQDRSRAAQGCRNRNARGPRRHPAVREAIDKGKADAAKELGKLMPAGMGGLPGF